MANNNLKIGPGLTFAPQASDPSGATEGDIYFNSVSLMYRYYDGSTWHTIQNENVVNSLNTLTGAVVLAAGTNITITPSGNTLTITGTGGAVAPTMSTVGTGTFSGAFPAAGTGIYTTPANVVYIRVRMVGSGGGGAGGGLAQPNGTAGTTTTFGSNSAGAGSGGGAYNGGSGGGASLGGTAVGTTIGGGAGGGGSANTSSTAVYALGGMGAPGFFGGSGGSNLFSVNGAPNFSGAGGAGGYGGTSVNNCGGGGGGAGGYCEFIIVPTSRQTFSYGVFAGGSGGSGGSGGGGGSGGASGYIEVTEFYANGAIGTATTITGNLPTSQITGTTTGNNAASGFIGEYISSNPGSPVTWGSTGVTTNITSISLTAGDWDVSGMIENVWAASSTITLFSGAISKSSGAEDATNGSGVFAYTPGSSGAGTSQWSSLSPRRISIGSTTTIYLVGNNTYTTLSTSNWGINSIIQARRVR